MLNSDMVSWILGIIIGFFGGYLTYRATCRNVFASVVSQSRMNWINKFREEVGIIVSALKMSQKMYDKDSNGDELQINCCGSEFEKAYIDLIINAEQARSRLLTRLKTDNNINNGYNEPLTNILTDIDFGMNEDYAGTIENIQRLTKKILEPEWAKVKREAKGKEK